VDSVLSTSTKKHHSSKASKKAKGRHKTKYKSKRKGSDKAKHKFRIEKNGNATIKSYLKHRHEGSNILFCAKEQRAMTVYSLLRYGVGTSHLKETSSSSDALPNLHSKKTDVSYAYLLNADWVIPAESSKSQSDTESYDLESPEVSRILPASGSGSANVKENPSTSPTGVSGTSPTFISGSYNPNYLDDPELTTGKHRTVLNLSGYRGSIIPFVKAETLKDELNDQFRQRHPWMHSGVTLHKIRKLKRKILDIATERDYEISSTGLSYVLLDKLLLANHIYKDNLKLFGAICLVLSVKFNDPQGVSKFDSRAFYESCEKHLGVDPKDLIQNEFDVFAKLSFGLFVPPSQVIPHCHRLKTDLEIGYESD